MKFYAAGNRVGNFVIEATKGRMDKEANYRVTKGCTVTPQILWWDRDPVTNILQRGPEMFDTEFPLPVTLMELERFYGKDKWRKPYEAFLQEKVRLGLLTTERPKRVFHTTLSEEEWQRVQAERASENAAADEPNAAPRVEAPRVQAKQGIRTVQSGK